MKTIHQWLDAYGESHQHHTNELVHWICVPVIFFCVVGFLGLVPPLHVPGLIEIRVDVFVIALASCFYLFRSVPLWIGVSLFAVVCLLLARWIDHHAPWPSWTFFLGLFVAAWTGQFIGHRIEGKKPSFLKDLQFLLIGPAWLLAKVCKRLGIGY